MLEKEIERITRAALDSIREFGAGASYSQISRKLHPALLRHISASIEDTIMDERKRLMSDSSFDYSGEEVNKYYELILKTVRRTKAFDMAFYETLIRESAALNVYLLSNPQKSLTQIIFHDDSTKDIVDIQKTLSNCYYYDYIKKVILTYAKRKNLHYFDYQDFKEFLGKAYKELLGAYPRTILDGTITAISDFNSIAGGQGAKIPKDMFIMFLESNYLPDLAEKVKFMAGDAEEIKPSDAQKTVHEFFKKDEKGYNLLKTDFIPSINEPFHIPESKNKPSSEMPKDAAFYETLKNRKAINFNMDEPAPKTEMMPEPVQPAAAAEPPKEVKTEIREAPLPKQVDEKKEKSVETPAPESVKPEEDKAAAQDVAVHMLEKDVVKASEPLATEIGKDEQVQTEKDIAEIVRAAVDKMENPKDTVEEPKNAEEEIVQIEPEDPPVIIEEEIEPEAAAEEPVKNEPPASQHMETAPEPKIEEEIINEPANKVEAPKQEEEIPQAKEEEPKEIIEEALKEPKITEPEVIAPAALNEAVKEEPKPAVEPEKPKVQAPPQQQQMRRVPPQQPQARPESERMKTLPSDIEKAGNDFILDEIINDDFVSVEDTPASESDSEDTVELNLPRKTDVKLEEAKPDSETANMNIGEIMMKNIMISGESDEEKEDRTIRRGPSIPGERDLASFMDEKTMERLVSNVFNEDMEEFMFLLEQLEKSPNYGEASSLLEKILKVKKTPNGLKEAEQFKEAVKEYFNQKK